MRILKHSIMSSRSSTEVTMAVHSSTYSVVRGVRIQQSYHQMKIQNTSMKGRKECLPYNWSWMPLQINIDDWSQVIAEIFLSGENKYPKTPIDAYDLLKGWNKHQHPRGPTPVGMTFNNNEGEDGTALVNDGTKTKKKCSRYGRGTTSLPIVMPNIILMEQSYMS